MINEIKASKPEIRNRMLMLRKENPSEISLEVFIESLDHVDKSRINMVMPFLSIISKNEIDTNAIINYFWKLKLKVVVPIVTDENLRLAQITPATPLVTGKFEVPEPQNPVYLNGKPEIIITPLLAFNNSGHRIGYGKGFYDRFLATLTNNPLIIGIGNNYMEANFDAEPFDFPMHGIITETGLRIFNPHPLFIQND